MTTFLIIEDEELNANRLERMIKTIDSSYIIVDKIQSVSDAVNWLKNNPNPDVIFMDIQLSDGLSFEIFSQTTITSKVIFTTAFDEYALKAFQVDGIDYLLKPLDLEKLKKSLSKIENLKIEGPKFNFEHLAEILNNKKSDNYRNRFLVSYRDEYIAVSTQDIAYFVSENKTSFIISKSGKKYPVEYNLEEIENQLNPTVFFRVTRQIILTIGSIKQINNYFNGRLKIYLEPNIDTEIIVSREKGIQLKNWLDQ